MGSLVWMRRCILISGFFFLRAAGVFAGTMEDALARAVAEKDVSEVRVLLEEGARVAGVFRFCWRRPAAGR